MHQLKGIEIRNGKPIFYSLGDFVFQNNVVPIVPPDFCEQYGVPLDSDAKTAFNARSKGGKVGLHAFRENFLSVVPKIEFVQGNPVARVTMLPIELHFGCDWSVNGLPRAADAEATKVIAVRYREIVRSRLSPRCEASPDLHFRVRAAVRQPRLPLRHR